MNVQTFATSDLVVVIGWTLLHSLWQIALVSLVLFAILRILRNTSANLRYVVSVSFLAISLGLPVFTFIQISTGLQAEAATHGAISVADRRIRNENVGAITPSRSDERAVAGYNAATADFLSDLRNNSNRYVSSFLPLAVFTWLLGVVFFSIRLGGGFWQLRRYTSASSTETDERWQQVFYRLCDRVGIGQQVRFLKTSSVDTPIAIGVFKPMILIPAGLFLQISPRELETVIVHELIHIRRYDPLINIAQCLAETLFFYHPAVWWISAHVRREREFAADAAVIEIFKDSHAVYASALANLEEIRLRTNKQMPRYATAANGGNLMQRIQKILKTKTEAGTSSSAWTAGLALLPTSAFLLAIFSFNTSSLVNTQPKNERKLAIGFVSIPPVDRSANAPKDADATARLLIEKLKAHKVPAIGFLQGGMVSDGEKLFPVRANIARMWRDAGFEVGLGGFRHIYLYDTPVNEYIANLEKNERVAKQLLGDQAVPPRYFSYPFLNTGKTVEDKAKVEAWLAGRGYTSVKYSFDNQEWMYSWAYDMARNDNDVNTMKQVRESYLAYMEKMFEHYEAYSRQMFGRDIAQTMVLTPSRLITDTADEFFAMAAKRGYTFITVDEAQGDEAYKTKENFTGEAGISWFERWSMTQGRKLLDEPRVHGIVSNAWEARNKK